MPASGSTARCAPPPAAARGKEPPWQGGWRTSSTARHSTWCTGSIQLMCFALWLHKPGRLLDCCRFCSHDVISRNSRAHTVRRRCICTVVPRGRLVRRALRLACRLCVASGGFGRPPLAGGGGAGGAAARRGNCTNCCRHECSSQFLLASSGVRSGSSKLQVTRGMANYRLLWPVAPR